MTLASVGNAGCTAFARTQSARSAGITGSISLQPAPRAKAIVRKGYFLALTGSGASRFDEGACVAISSQVGRALLRKIRAIYATRLDDSRKGDFFGLGLLSLFPSNFRFERVGTKKMAMALLDRHFERWKLEIWLDERPGVQRDREEGAMDCRELILFPPPLFVENSEQAVFL
jgi:hypothetical protein